LALLEAQDATGVPVREKAIKPGWLSGSQVGLSSKAR